MTCNCDRDKQALLPPKLLFVEIFCYHNRKETQKEPHKHSLPDLFLGSQFRWVPEVVAHQKLRKQGPGHHLLEDGSVLGCKDLRNHQPSGGSIWGHIMRACRGKVISKETRKTLLCSAPHSQACFLLLSPRASQAPFSLLECAPLPHVVPQHAGTKTQRCPFPFRASSQ